MLGEAGHTEPQGHWLDFYNWSFGTSAVVHGCSLVSHVSYKSNGLKEDDIDTPTIAF